MDHHNSSIVEKGVHLPTDAHLDPLLLVRVDKDVDNIYQTLQIVEKSDEDGRRYRSPSSRRDYYSIAALSSIQQSEARKRQDSHSDQLSSSSDMDDSDPQGKQPPRYQRKKRDSSQRFTPFSHSQNSYEGQWSWVEEYHRNHSKISPSCLEKRHALLREITQMYPTQESDHNYVVYSPTKAGLGNTLLAMSEALLLAIYSKRNFASRSNENRYLRCINSVLLCLVYRWNTILEFYTFPYHHPIIHKKST